MTTTESALVADWETWHRDREDLLATPHGWLSLTGLHWLDEAPAAYPDLPGTWRATGDGGVELVVDADAAVSVDGTPVAGTVRVDPVDGKPGVLVAVRERRVEVIRRTDSYALRVRDPRAVTRTAFAGVPAFPVEQRWVRPGRFEPYPAPRPITVGAVVEGLMHRFEAMGEVVFDLDGAEQRLVALAGLSVHFRDGSSGDSTYGGGRAVLNADPAADGSVTVDLNRASNLPCAFTSHATCPLPPAGNVVTAPVEAGEKTPPRPDLA
ncbi:DUF1684 domain-containing protein [Pseudonocardia sp. N23]|uniref:DUF1684 domain-containing protein n=1 Tax=Pseudonocardia sp. N23 TaxID=1987376 RepID=UPI000BFDD24F|nr:DUF1684 domain-containing protein [Pseudonocardia sp. N23]GAY08001.1 hypothetical protein TOK_6194 [Pseudonocardia sp. N23]